MAHIWSIIISSLEVQPHRLSLCMCYMQWRRERQWSVWGRDSLCMYSCSIVLFSGHVMTCCTCNFMCTHTHIYTHTCTHIFTHTFAYTHIHTYTHTYRDSYSFNMCNIVLSNASNVLTSAHLRWERRVIPVWYYCGIIVTTAITLSTEKIGWFCHMTSLSWSHVLCSDTCALLV